MQIKEREGERTEGTQGRKENGNAEEEEDEDTAMVLKDGKDGKRKEEKRAEKTNVNKSRRDEFMRTGKQEWIGFELRDELKHLSAY